MTTAVQPKRRHRCCILPLLLGCSIGTKVSADDAGKQLRGIPGGVGIAGWGHPTWGGRTFDESPVANNIWSLGPHVPGLGVLQPTAPLDRVDKTWTDTISGASPLAPREVEAEAHEPPLRPDYVPPYNHPLYFPGDERHEEKNHLPVIPLKDKKVVAAPDKLRAPYGTVQQSVQDNYPLQAPADKISHSDASGPVPVSEGDVIPDDIARFVNQLHDREAELREANKQHNIFKRVDINMDKTISSEEFGKELQGRQNKSAMEASRLWSKYKTGTTSNDMTEAEFKRLSSTGYDMGSIKRNDVSSVLTPPGVRSHGFWGSGAACPDGTYVKGVRLKIMPHAVTPKQDSTGLNRVALRCTNGVEVQTVEGPDGTWTEWAECPKDQVVYSIRLRMMEYQIGQDNSGVNGMALACRNPDLSAFSQLRFGSGFWVASPTTIVGEGPLAMGGGWSRELMCQVRESMCGMQANVLRDQGKNDDMGITDLRAYCCSSTIDCTPICQGIGNAVKCRVCKQAAVFQR